MAYKWIKSKFPGIRYYEHEERKLKGGIQKDKYFSIMYRLNGKRKDEAIGWASKGWTLQKANEILCTLKENIRLGKHPQTLAEMREMDKQSTKAQEQKENETESEMITLNEVFYKYLEVHKVETSERNWKNSLCNYKKWIEEPLGSVKLCEITIEQIQNLVNEAFKTLAPKTILHIRNLVRQIFNFSKKHDLYLKDNPATKVKIKQEDNKRTRFLTREEAGLLLEELKKWSIDIHDEALLSMYSGMRAGEIFNLQWERVLWHIDRIHITKTKNGEDRMEPMHPLVKEMLQQRYLDSQTGYVFKSRTGGKIKEVSDTFGRAVDKLGFNKEITDRKQKIVFHSLRHTYASWLVMNGVDLYTTQKLMGHKSNQMIQRYAHLAPGHLEKAVNTLPSI